jgi:ectoine hydroxylase-related dioxygenase (phytanoyl-CoA dioxygenase family)
MWMLARPHRTRTRTRPSLRLYCRPGVGAVGSRAGPASRDSVAIVVIASSLEESALHLREEGWVTVPDVFVGEELEHLREGLATALDAARAEGQILFREGVDVNDRSVRVLHLFDQHPAFAQMVDHRTVRQVVSSVLGEQYLLSSLSANISLPGSESMGIHNDLMAVLPEPWLAPYGTNLFICLDDMDEENGATRYLPGSHRFATNDMADDGDLGRTVAIPASAGSVVAMDGRLWHTSGANRSTDRPRRILIAFYIASFIRTQYNWAALLSEPIKDRLTPDLRQLLGLDDGNMGVRLRYAAFSGTKQGVDPHAH